MKIYTAGPLGFSEAGRAFHNGTIIPTLARLGHQPLDPWTLTDQDKIDAAMKLPYGQARKEAWQALNREIGNNNRKAIDECDAVLAVLDGTDVDSGTAAEIGYAFARAKPIIGYRGDFRPAGDNEGSIVNLQVEFFIHSSGGCIIETIDSLEAALARIAPKAVP